MSREIKNIIFLFITWRVIIFLIGFFISTLFPHQIGGRVYYQDVVNLFAPLANWDGGHFIGISRNGYSQDIQYAFFPLYPLLIKSTGFIFLENYLAAGIFLSSLFTFLSLVILYKVAKMDFTEEISFKVLVYLLLSPTAFFLVTVYAESLLLLLSVSAFYFLRRGNSLLASLSASFASAASPLGIVLTPALIFYHLWKVKFRLSKIKSNVFFLLIAPVGLISYMLFLLFDRGNPFLFLTVQENWQRGITLPWVTLFNYTKPLFSTSFFGTYAYSQRLLEVAIFILACYLLLRSFRSLPSYYLVFSFLFLLSILVSGSLGSSPRIILPVFPIFISLALLGKNHLFNFSYLFSSILLMAVFLILFFNGFWIA